MRSLVFGAGGLLGRPLKEELRRRGDEVLPLTRGEVDITDAPRVKEVVRAAKAAGEQTEPAEDEQPTSEDTDDE